MELSTYKYVLTHFNSLRGCTMCFKQCLLVISLLALRAETQDKWNGESYLKNSSSQANEAVRLIGQKTLPSTIENLWVFGCGTGNNIPLYQKHFKPQNIFANDLSFNMVETAKKRFGNESTISLTQSGVKDFWAERKINLAISVYTLHWIPREEMPLVLENIYNNLASNGYLATALGAAKEGMLFREVLNNLKASTQYKSDFTGFIQTHIFYEVSDIKQLLDEKNFIIDTLDEETLRKFFDNAHAFKGAIQQWLPEYKFLARKNQNLADQFMDDLINEYVLYSKQQPNAPIFWDVKIITLIAHRK